MARIDFADWLQKQLDAKGWHAAELARRSGLTQSYLSRVLRRERNIGHDAAAAIAAPFGLSISEVKIIAGLQKPDPPTDTPTIREMNGAFAYLTKEEQDFWLGMLQTYVAERKRGYVVNPQDNPV